MQEIVHLQVINKIRVWEGDVMVKEYKLDVEQLHEIEGHSILGYYSKGHQDKVEFLESLIYDWEILKTNPNLKEEDIQENIKHIWAKLVPWATGGMVFTYSDEYKKGYFPVTQFEF